MEKMYSRIILNCNLTFFKTNLITTSLEQLLFMFQVQLATSYTRKKLTACIAVVKVLLASRSTDAATMTMVLTLWGLKKRTRKNYILCVIYRKFRIRLSSLVLVNFFLLFNFHQMTNKLYSHHHQRICKCCRSTFPCKHHSLNNFVAPICI